MKKTIFLIIIFSILSAHAIVLNANAAASVSEPPALEMHASRTSVTLYAGFSQKVAISFAPETVEIGIDCGMPEMCGIDPCTCGSADTWGSCSCNGLCAAAPDVAISIDSEKTAIAAYKDGTLKIKALSPGTATITLTASLPHHVAAHQTIEVHVRKIPLYIIPLIGIAITVLAIFAGITHSRKRRPR